MAKLLNGFKNSSTTPVSTPSSNKSLLNLTLVNNSEFDSICLSISFFVAKPALIPSCARKSSAFCAVSTRVAPAASFSNKNSLYSSDVGVGSVRTYSS